MATDHYSIPELNRNNGISADSINAAYQKIDSEMWKLFQFRGNLTSSHDLNNLSGDGFWRIEGTAPLHSPSNATWSFVWQVAYGTLAHQYFFKPAANALMVREYSGNPQVWSEWRSIGGYEAITRVTFDATNNSYFEYWRSGQTACLKMFYKVESGTINSWTVKEVGTVPAGFRPAQVIMTRGCVDRASDDGTCFSVDSNGSVKVQTRFNSFDTADDVLQGILTYPIRY